MYSNYEPFTPNQEIEILNPVIVENFAHLTEITSEQRMVIDGMSINETDLFSLQILESFSIFNTLQYWANLSSITEAQAKLICLKYGINIQSNNIVTPISILGIDTSIDVFEHLAEYFG
jgi:hypothetical protein